MLMGKGSLFCSMKPHGPFLFAVELPQVKLSGLLKVSRLISDFELGVILNCCIPW